MIYQKKPGNFDPSFEVVSCFLECDGKILLLRRQDHRPEGDTWGVVAGKINDKEELREAIVRETKEESGLDLPYSRFSYFEKVYVKYSEYDFVYHIFHAKLDEMRDVVINSDEHKDFKWISPKGALDMSLIQDLDACIELFYGV